MIAIIGGGIGGLTTALALQQSGFQFAVFEQAPALLDVGAAIAIWPNAMRVLTRMQLAEKIIAKAGVMEEIRWLDQHGWLINSVAISSNSSSGDSNFPAVALHRADLQSILLHTLPTSSIHLGHSLVSYSQQGDKVVATFANGSSVEADLLVGADGIHSRVRAQFLDDGEPVYRGYIVWRGISPTIPSAIPPATAVEIHGCGSRFGIGPVGMGRVGWWATANAAAIDTKFDLLRLFAGWYPPVLELIEATPALIDPEDRRFRSSAKQSWGGGRMTLLGDAIHPTTPNLGQGGCLAMEDALVLSRCLEKYGETEAALRRYEQLRRQRTTAVSQYSLYYGRVGQWENVFARGLRRSALSLLPEALAQRLMQIVFDYEA